VKHFLLSCAAAAAITTLVSAPAGAQAGHYRAALPGAIGDPTDHPSADPASGTTGKVVETMDAGEYTYVQVDDGSKKIWAAAPKFAVATGDIVVVPQGAPMQNFYSKTLQRSFEVVYFVGAIQVVGGQKAREHVAAVHGALGQNAAAAPAVDLSNIAKADGGYTVAELFANRATLAGKDVTVRGRVTKFTPAIMGKNWMHVRDGSGQAGSNDLTVSTSATAAVGDTVLVRGTLHTDKDFGFGYRYDVIVEDARVATE